LLFNVKEIVVEAYKIAIYISGWIIYYFIYILGFLFPSSEGQGGEGSGQQDMMLPEGDGGNPIVSLILTIIVVLIGVAVAVWALPRLARAFIEKTKLFRNKLARFLRNFFAVNKMDVKLEFEEFIDHVEIIKEAPDNRDAKRKSRTLPRKLKHINDPILKIRLIYRTIIYAYKDTLEINRSNTAGEILKKSRKLEIDEQEFGEITDTYEKARYGGIAPSEDSLKNSEASIRAVIIFAAFPEDAFLIFPIYEDLLL
jgi:hypothetical protein